jgi:hypothetical protein
MSGPIAIQPTMTPEEEAAWMETMRRGELPRGLFQGEVRRASQRRAKIRWNIKALQASHEGKQARCVHHWILDAPNGATVKGICKKCGAEREFSSLCDNDPENGRRALCIRGGRRGAAARWGKARRPYRTLRS